MTKTVEIIWDQRESEGFAFDVSFAGLRFARHRDIASSSKFVADITAAARRFGGYRFINARKAFLPAWDFAGDRAAAFVAQLVAQGWTIQHRGHLPAFLLASDNFQVAA